MKAKEITEKCYSPLMGKYVFDDEDLQDYADALCKEQRKMCVGSWESSPDDPLKEHDAILNATQPEAL